MIDEWEVLASVESATPAAPRSTAAFVALYQAQYRRLVQMSYLILGDLSQAEEVVQDAFANVYQRWSSIADLPYVEAYLGRAVVNGCRMAHRSRSRTLRPVKLLPTATPDPFDEVMQRTNQAELVQALAKLSPRQRECVVARYLLELSEGEAARLLSLSIGSVRTHTHRGIRSLQKLLVQP